MSTNYALIIALVIAVALITIPTQRITCWPWYAGAAIILAGCAYTYLKPGNWFASWGSSWATSDSGR